MRLPCTTARAQPRPAEAFLALLVRSAIDAMALKQKFHSLVDDMISEGHSAPNGQAKATLPVQGAGGGSSAPAPSKAASAAGATEPPASIAKIKIKKKAKIEGASNGSTPLPDDGPTQPPGAPALADSSQSMDVDQPESAEPPASLDPASLAALQQLMTSGVLDVGMQQAANDEDGAHVPSTAAAPPLTDVVPSDKKPTRKEQRQLAKDQKAEKKAGVEVGKASLPALPLAPAQQQQQVQSSAAQPSGSPAPVQPGYPQSPLPTSQQAAAPSPAATSASAAPAAALSVKVKVPSILASFIVRFPGSERREIRMYNDRGIKAHALSVVSEQEVALVMDLRDLHKGKGREFSGDLSTAADSDVALSAAAQANGSGDLEMAMMGADVNALQNGGDHALALPPPPGPPKRLFAIGVTSNSVLVESFPPSLRRMPSNLYLTPADEAFVADPPLAYNLSLTVGGALGRAGPVAGTGAWIIEVAVRWRDVDEQTGAVVEQGHEAYELFLRR